MRFGRLAAVLALTVACGPAPEARPQAGVPQGRVEAEFRETARAATPLAEAVAGDTAAFLALVQPFGPLDLVVLKAQSSEHASHLRGFFLGVVGGAAQIDPAPLADRWHCGPPCAAARRDTLVGRLPAVRTLVERYGALPRLDVVAPWPGGGYRAGTVTYDGQEFRTLTSSPGIGFLPWRSSAAASGDTALAAQGADRAAVEALVTELRAAGLAALARDAAGSVRAVLAGGISDNEAGLLFLAPGVAAPSPSAADLPDGRRHLGAEPVAPGVYFYVTT